VTIHDNEVTCRVLEGEEEEKYLAKVLEEMSASKNKFNKSKRGAKKGKKSFSSINISQLSIIMQS